MALITYEDKSNSLPITNVRRIYRDIDANEVKNVVNANAAELITKEYNRAWTETLVFDKNEIFYVQHELTSDVNYTIAASGNLSGQSSGMRQRIITDGTHAINFGAGFDYIYGITNGGILEAGNYEVYFIRDPTGSVVVNIPGVSQQTSGLTQLSAPGSFVVTPDGVDTNTKLNMSWADVANETGYQVERSLTGSGSWVLYSNPVINATSASESGLTPGSTIFYRIKALGDGVTYADSPYSTASGTTGNSGDVTAPTFTFNPVNASSVHPVNKSIVITASEPLRKDDGSTLSSNDTGIIVLKQTNSGGADIACTWTVDVTKTVITVIPTTTLGTNQLVYLSIDGVEDATGNESVLTSITFTTTAYSYLNGTSNRVIFGDILDGTFAVNDTNFWLEATVNNAAASGSRVIWAKMVAGSTTECFRLYYNGTTVAFYFSMSNQANRAIVWTGTDMDTGEHTIVLRYDGTIDTNDGLDRCTLLIDGVTQTSKVVSNPSGTLIGTLTNVTAQLSAGIEVNAAGTPGTTLWFEGEMKDLIIRSGSGSVVELNVPVLRVGTDTSGNARNGTWV